ncbi:MAG TPA: arylsulfatase [Bacteroidales bacterium]|nr:arylsulfatase [Bacteroidales bacterium]HOK73883.1 arylsulfatase [Bacteroidales bacterium]HOM39615.1 arylsulfatase [Bacteroidales bacterium]HPP91637.1 arylsulfatase [Bacteroidales bacterium]HRR15826.1 arylsulfatase [Bacteroidales bacterium]
MKCFDYKLPALVLLTGTFASCSTGRNNKELPDIVFIIADDLGYGDLSCYGQKKFQTPNIDRLASEGMLFTRHYAGSTVSAPSRSSLMTGMHTGHTPIRGNREWKPEGQWPLPAESFTIAEMLKKIGYTTGAFGKWGLGFINTEGDPNSQGFDEFFGYNCQRLAHNYYPEYLWHNHEKIFLHENDSGKTGAYSADLIHRAALEFIENNKDKPFFLFYPTTIPHAELFAKEEYMQKFRGKFEPEKSFKGVDDGPDFRKGPYGSQPEGHAAFAAMITELDDYVGDLLRKLDELNLTKKTIVFFTSDNGPHLEGGADPDYFDSNGPLRGYKRDLYEGGIRVPMIVRWPGVIKEGSQTNHISAFWDVMPTLAEITGAKVPDGIDGISFLPSLLGRKKQKQHDYLYWEFHEQGGKQAVRMGNWKGVRLNVNKDPEGKIELYNLSDDPGETKDVSEEYGDIVKKIDEIMKQAHTKSDIFRFAFEQTEN